MRVHSSEVEIAKLYKMVKYKYCRHSVIEQKKNDKFHLFKD